MSSKVKSLADQEAVRILKTLQTTDVNSPEYEALIKQLEKIENVKKGTPRGFFRSIDSKTVISGCFTILAVVVVAVVEERHVLSSRAMKFIK